jgi:hypothetical protein
MAQYQMQARSSTDGQLYSWISPTRDFAGTGFPGPGAAQHVVVARAVRDDVTGALAGGVDNGDDIKFNTTSHAWERRRGYITVLADPTGVTNAESAIRAALASARSGQCVFLPDGVYLVNHATPIPIPPGVTLVGAERGHNTGPFTVGSTVSLGHMGTQLRIVGTPNLFQVQAQASALHLEVYYPNQNGASAESGHGTFSGTPVEYGWTFDCLGSQNPTIEHITALNPLDFIRISSGTGCSVEDIWAWPLRNGLQLGRIADVAGLTMRARFFDLADNVPLTDSYAVITDTNDTRATSGLMTLQGLRSYQIQVEVTGADGGFGTVRGAAPTV